MVFNCDFPDAHFRFALPVFGSYYQVTTQKQRAPWIVRIGFPSAITKSRHGAERRRRSQGAVRMSWTIEYLPECQVVRIITSGRMTLGLIKQMASAGLAGAAKQPAGFLSTIAT
jgi:hypothetical protein